MTIDHSDHEYRGHVLRIIGPVDGRFRAQIRRSAGPEADVWLDVYEPGSSKTVFPSAVLATVRACHAIDALIDPHRLPTPPPPENP